MNWWALAASFAYMAGAMINFNGAWHASKRPHGRPWFWSFVFIGAMCVMYVAFWGVLVPPDVVKDRSDWSKAITPASTLFPLVFSLPAYLETRVQATIPEVHRGRNN